MYQNSAPACAAYSVNDVQRTQLIMARGEAVEELSEGSGKQSFSAGRKVSRCGMLPYECKILSVSFLA